MTMNEYGRNNYLYYIINMLITVSFCATMIIAYVKTNPWITTFVIIYIALFSYFLLIKPAIKIYKGTADTKDLDTIGIFPILGLFRKHYSQYQIMAEKLENEEAILECKHVLEEMNHNFGQEIKYYINWFFDLEHGYTTEVLGNIPSLPPVKQHEFESGIANFFKLFPKIENSDKNHKQRLELLKNMLCLMINYYHNEILNDFEQKIGYIGNGYLVAKMDIIECLRYKRAKFILHINPDVSDRAFKKELNKKTSWINELLENITESNIDVVFDEIYKANN